ncbi:hypothetical protein HLK59_10285 [Streptomyces sp. S3(2020)]|uniref:hypothetical protein n=1 Tax=Streptomyces sp. S3(2020) TaxID=2732044 RepID=UPI001487FDED|nr:hypothetical protein [Streptomyces sp. S3(2020)]NNN30745.1 hypothetical protein [Streptomyces sp. S3(2020)]
MSGYTPQAPGRDRPLLVLGVSGVITLEDPPRVPAARVRLRAWAKWGRDLVVADDAPDRLATLSDGFQIVWASEWGHVAHEALRDVLRLPREPWPFLPVQFDKLPAILSYAGERPWAWVDEPAADLTRAVPRPAAGVVVRVDPAVGISQVDPDELSRRVAALE